MRIWLRRIRASIRAAVPPLTNWKYSDTCYLFAGVSGTVGISFGGSGVTGVIAPHTALVVAFAATTITTALLGAGKYLQSKGD